MRVFLRAVIIFIIIFLGYTLYVQFGYYESEKRDTEDTNISNEQLEEEKLILPNDGLLTLVGKSTDDIKKIIGEPDRIDPSAYDYDWWIYGNDPKQYVQIGVLNNKVVSAYGIGESLNADPFKIGQPIQEVFQIAPMSPSISAEYKGNSYRFELSEEDMNTRPSVKFGNVYVQLYIDKFDGNLSSIRVMDEETFIKQRSYEVIFRGELIEPEFVTADKWKEIEKGSEKQIFAITNMIRKRHQLETLQWEETVAKVAYLHSTDMKENNYFSHESPTKGSLVNRLAEYKVNYEMAGENIAAQYVDGIAAVEGWLNSKGHREALLNDEFTHLGVGVDELYYTQNFIKLR
ncbi:CAP-associated domain-containing protein [Metabacillus fastidiosus]|uniref:CAP domain-containing protein n=1 Tax=Metabacillus fastidiosus TaxID=1458 RepID=UPI002E22F370|nr:CAP-associated domain-containing protein [Metabacillus fastidiosus]